MRIRYTLTLPVLATAAALIAPALAEMPGGSQTAPDQSIGARHMGHGMMSRGMMSGGGCADMMQSMNGGGGPPNSQWQKRSQGNAMPN